MKKPSESDQSAWTIARLVKWTTDYFLSHNIDSPRMTAELLLSFALGIKRIDLYLQYDKPLEHDELSRFKALIKRRINREPLAYITGSQGFWTLDLDVTDKVLIPRPDTECLVGAALEIIPDNEGGGSLSILDLGTGSGAVVIALASERPWNRYVAVDISEDAARVAMANCRKNLSESSVSIVVGDWFEQFTESSRFDIIVSNPPYIPTKDIPGLQPEITGFEPVRALDGDGDGLKCIRHILCNAGSFLKTGGWVLLETGFDQKESVVSILENCGGFGNIECFQDLGGNHRVVRAKKI